MPPLCRCLTAQVCVALAWVSVVSFPQAQENPKWPDELKTLEFAPNKRTPDLRLWITLREVVRAGTELTARGVSACADGRVDLYPPIRFPPLKAGDVVPLYGQLYRVSKLVEGGPPGRIPTASSARMTAQWLDGASLPDAARLRLSFPFSVAAPLRPEGDSETLVPHSFCVVVSAIEPSQQRGPVASVTLSFGMGYWAAELHAGDVVLIKGQGYRVASVVPRDEKTGVIGWVEFDRRPLSEAALKEAKTAVRPRFLRDGRTIDQINK